MSTDATANISRKSKMKFLPIMAANADVAGNPHLSFSRSTTSTMTAKKIGEIGEAAQGFIGVSGKMATLTLCSFYATIATKPSAF